MGKNKNKEELIKAINNMTPFWSMCRESMERRTQAQTHICDIVERFGESVGKNAMRFTFKKGDEPCLGILENGDKENNLRVVSVSAVEIRNRTESSLGSMTLYEGRKSCNGTLLSTETWLTLYAGLYIAARKMLREME